jgi:hypothetical protein
LQPSRRFIASAHRSHSGGARFHSSCIARRRACAPVARPRGSRRGTCGQMTRIAERTTVCDPTRPI